MGRDWKQNKKQETSDREWHHHVFVSKVLLWFLMNKNMREGVDNKDINNREYITRKWDERSWGRTEKTSVTLGWFSAREGARLEKEGKFLREVINSFLSLKFNVVSNTVVCCCPTFMSRSTCVSVPPSSIAFFNWRPIKDEVSETWGRNSLFSPQTLLGNTVLSLQGKTDEEDSKKFNSWEEGPLSIFPGMTKTSRREKRRDASKSLSLHKSLLVSLKRFSFKSPLT